MKLFLKNLWIYLNLAMIFLKNRKKRKKRKKKTEEEKKAKATKYKIYHLFLISIISCKPSLVEYFYDLEHVSKFQFIFDYNKL